MRSTALAALLFGGLPTDYLISSVEINLANINNSAWYSTWGSDQYVTVAVTYTSRVRNPARSHSLAFFVCRRSAAS